MPAIPAQPDSPENDKDLSHDWIGAATIKLDPKTAKHADFRGSFRTKETNVRIDVLEVYCSGCRRPYEDVADEACEAKINNEHLIGGNPGERKKRKLPPPVDPALLERGPAINRVGVEAIARGGATFGRNGR